MGLNLVVVGRTGPPLRRVTSTTPVDISDIGQPSFPQKDEVRDHAADALEVGRPKS